MNILKVVCDYDGTPAVLHLSSTHLYQGRDFGPVWECPKCGAYVGTHKDSRDHKPLGRLANAELREAKQRAHAAFDPLWRAKMRRDGCSKGKARNAGYAWLAMEMGMTKAECHVGMMSVDQCLRVVQICASLKLRRS